MRRVAASRSGGGGARIDDAGDRRQVGHVGEEPPGTGGLPPRRVPPRPVPASRKAVVDAHANSGVPQVIVQESQLQDIVTKALAKAQLGQASVQDALNGAATQVDALLK